MRWSWGCVAVWCVACAPPVAPRDEAAAVEARVSPAGLEAAQDAARQATWVARADGLLALTQWSCPVEAELDGFLSTSPGEFFKAPREGQFVMTGAFAVNYFAERGEGVRLLVSAPLDLTAREQHILIFYDLHCGVSPHAQRRWQRCDGGYCAIEPPKWMAYYDIPEPVPRTGRQVELGKICSSYKRYAYASALAKNEAPEPHHEAVCAPERDVCQESWERRWLRRCEVEGGYRFKGVVRYVGVKEIDGFVVHQWRFDVIRSGLGR